MKKSKENNKPANDTHTCEHSSDVDRGFSLGKDEEYCEFCDEVFTWSAGAYHYKCWIR